MGGRLPAASLASHGPPWSSLVLLPAQAGSVFLTTSLERAAEVGIPPHSCHEHDHHRGEREFPFPSIPKNESSSAMRDIVGRSREEKNLSTAVMVDVGFHNSYCV